MSVLRARMKPGVRPIVIGVYEVPEYPTYWAVPAQYADAVAALAADGQLEYEQEISRAADGTFAAPGLQVVQRTEPSQAANKFSRKGR